VFCGTSEAPDAALTARLTSLRLPVLFRVVLHESPVDTWLDMLRHLCVFSQQLPRPTVICVCTFERRLGLGQKVRRLLKGGEDRVARFGTLNGVARVCILSDIGLVTEREVMELLSVYGLNGKQYDQALAGILQGQRTIDTIDPSILADRLDLFLSNKDSL
jgi:hypothetical protein